MLTQARSMVGQHQKMDQSYRKALVEEYAPVLEGIQNPQIKGNVAVLMENQNKFLDELAEDASFTSNLGSFAKYLFPVLRRVFPNLILNELVSVQPIPAPVSAVFVYEYKYGDTKGGITQNQNLIETFNKNYSSEKIDYEIKVAATDTDGTKQVWDDSTNQTDRIPFKWLPVRSYEDIGSAIYRVQVSFTKKSDDSTVTLTDDGSGNLKSGSDTVGTIDYDTGAWTLDTSVISATPKSGTPITAMYFYNSEYADVHFQSPAVDGTKYDSNSSQVKKNPTVKLDIAMSTVEAKSRQLAATWSAKSVQNLKAFYGKDAEAELVTGISNEIAMEIDQEGIDLMIDNAAHTASWAYSPAFGGANTMTELESIRSLLTAIDAVSARIHKTTKRAPANFIVCSTAVSALLAQLQTDSDYMRENKAIVPVKNPSYGLIHSDMGIYRMGTLNNKYTVYVDPFIDDDKILLGLKGRSFLDAGMVYAPFIPLETTPTFVNPENFMFSKGLMTRYAMKMLRNEYYGVINVTGLPTVTTT